MIGVKDPMLRADRLSPGDVWAKKRIIPRWRSYHRDTYVVSARDRYWIVERDWSKEIRTASHDTTYPLRGLIVQQVH